MGERLFWFSEVDSSKTNKNKPAKDNTSGILNNQRFRKSIL